MSALARSPRSTRLFSALRRSRALVIAAPACAGGERRVRPAHGRGDWISNVVGVLATTPLDRAVTATPFPPAFGMVALPSRVRRPPLRRGSPVNANRFHARETSHHRTDRSIDWKTTVHRIGLRRGATGKGPPMSEPMTYASTTASSGPGTAPTPSWDETVAGRS